MKPGLESSFYLKIKNESNRLIGMVKMIEILSYPVYILMFSSISFWHKDNYFCIAATLEKKVSTTKYFYTSNFFPEEEEMEGYFLGFPCTFILQSSNINLTREMLCRIFNA